MIHRITSNLLESNMYIVSENSHALIIDPCDNIVPYSPSLCYDWIILTHEHYDHISGVNIWKELTGAKVLCGQECAEHIENPKGNFSRHFKEFASLQTMFDASSVPESKDYSCKADEIFKDERLLSWKGHDLRLFSTPGHSEGSICILFDKRFLFSGDTILHRSETALRFPGGSKRKWEEITVPKIKEIKKLERGGNIQGEIVVYPGHFESFKLKDWIEYDRF